VKPQSPAPPASPTSDPAVKQPRNVPTLTEVVAPLVRSASSGRVELRGGGRVDPDTLGLPGRLTPIAAASASAVTSPPDSPPSGAPASLAASPPARTWLPSRPSAAPAAPATPKPDALAMLGQRVTMQVLLDMQRRTDAMLEQHLQQTLKPTLIQFAEQLKAEVRLEMARALREMVQVAVAQEISRHRDKNNS